MEYIDLNDLRRRAGNIINTEWKSSWYWGKEPKLRHWTMDAKHDCIKRIAEVEEELARLKAMRRELEDICPRYIPEDEEPGISEARRRALTGMSFNVPSIAEVRA